MAKKNGSEPYPIYTVKDLLELKDNPDRWIIQDMIPKQGRILVYGRGSVYKCRGAGQRVWMADGQARPINELEGLPDLTVTGYSEQQRKLIPIPAHVESNGVRPVKRIVTSTGRTLVATGNEPILTAIGWMPINTLMPGDFIAGAATMPEPMSPRPLPSGHAYLIGALLGDGSISKANLRITCFDADMQRHLASTAATAGMDLVAHGDPKKHFFYFRRGGPFACRYHMQDGTARTKRIPAAVFQGSNADVADVLGGYWDADGSFEKAHRDIIFTSVNRPMLEDVQILLHRIGCISTINKTAYTTKFSYWVLRCSGSHAAQFLLRAGLHSSKAAAARAYMGGDPEFLRDNEYTAVPAVLVEPYIEGLGQKFIRKYCSVALDTTGLRRRSRFWVQAVGSALLGLSVDPTPIRRARGIVKQLGSDELKRRGLGLLALANERDFYWDNVIAVEDAGEQPTWALSCPQTEKYICEGHITHNSAIIFDLCISVASGMRFLERLPVIRTFGPVLLLSTEGSIYTNSDRLKAYMRSRNLSPDAVQLFYGQRAIQIRKPEGIATVRALIKTFRPVLTVFDPFVSFYGGNENGSEEMAKFTEGLNEVVQEYETSVLIIHHANKKDDIRGSTVLQGWFDSILRFNVTKGVAIPGMMKKQDIIVVTSEKQRDGATHNDPPLFSAVPIFDKNLGMIIFGLYDKADVNGVVLASLKFEVLSYLRRTAATQPLDPVLTRDQLMKTYGVGADRMETVLRWLVADGLVEIWDTARSTGLGRTNIRKGYRASPLGTRIDIAQTVLRAARDGADTTN